MVKQAPEAGRKAARSKMNQAEESYGVQEEKEEYYPSNEELFTK